MDWFLNVRPETTKLPEESIGERCHDTGLGNNVMNVTPKTQAARTATMEVRLHQTKRLLSSKGKQLIEWKGNVWTGRKHLLPYIW